MTSSGRPWEPGAVSGVGSLPGTDPVEAMRLVLGELPLLPHLPELPARGASADMTGRSAALLVDLPVEIHPSGWRISSHAGRDVRRARDLLSRDLDALQELAGDRAGPLKVQVAGPWTLAAGVELPSGNRVLSDPGAVRDLTQSLAEGLRVHLADLRSRLPAASLVVQVDEPALPAALAALIPTASGFGTLRAVEPALAEQLLADVLAVAPEGGRIVHCCAADGPLALFRSAGADGVSVDLTSGTVGATLLDTLGEIIDSGGSVWAGVAPGTDAVVSLESMRTPVLQLWRALGFSPGELAGAVVPTPACGLAGASPNYVRRVLALLRDVGASLLDET